MADLMQKNAARLMHIGVIRDVGGSHLLFLREVDRKYHWFLEKRGEEEKTALGADKMEEAIQLAYREWGRLEFRFLGCGYRFTLPERDEHGDPASFYQMVKALQSSSYTYMDEDLGHLCVIKQIPSFARELYHRLSESKQLE